jgi:ArsR family transcriptional regulator
MTTANAQPDALLGWMDSLADATRLRLLRLLERHELGVAELCDVLQSPQSTVSRHLKILADQRWLHNRRQGTTNLYRMRVDELLPAARDLWQLARQQTDDWATLHQDQVRLARRLQDRKHTSEAFFAGAAGEWDKLREQLYGSGFNLAAALAMLPRDWTVADLGCGTASLSADLSRHVKRVIAVDQSAAMLAAAKQRVADVTNVDLRQGDLESLPIDDATCDAALLVLVLTYLADPALAIAEASRVLKPGGRLIVVDLLRHDRDNFRRQMGQASLGFDNDQLDAWFTDARLTLEQCNPLPPDPAATGPALLLAAGHRRG